MPEHYTVQQALEHAKAWCAKRPAWIPICEMEDTSRYYVQWDELSKQDQEGWGSEAVYDELARKRCKVEVGFISGNGAFFSDVLHVPPFHNFMTVYRVGTTAAKEIRARGAATPIIHQERQHSHIDI